MTQTTQHDLAPARRASTRGVAVAVGLAAVVVVALVAQVALHTDWGQRLDGDSMRTVVAGREARLTVISGLGRVSIGLVLAVALVCVVAALVRGRVTVAVAAVTVIVGANVTTQVLKHVVLHRSTFDVVAPNSLPSGHTTVIASAAAALILVSPRAIRPLVVIIGSFATVLVGASTVVAGWHRPSDVVTALAVCLAWTAVGSAIIGSGVRTSGAGVSAVLGSIAGLLVLVGIGVRPSYGWSGFAEAATVLGVLTVATAATVALMERSSSTRWRRVAGRQP